jgi:hypothetical protein
MKGLVPQRMDGRVVGPKCASFKNTLLPLTEEPLSYQLYEVFLYSKRKSEERGRPSLD